jgi:hypothetical protein
MSRTAEQIAAAASRVRALARKAPSLFSGTVPAGTLADPVVNKALQTIRAGKKINPLAQHNERAVARGKGK